MEEQLKQLYYSPSTGYLSADKLYRKAREANIQVTHKQVKSFLDSQETYQLNKQQRLPSVSRYNSYWADHPAKEYQADVMIYDRYEIHKYKYILCVIDIHSRKAAARPLTNKNLTTYISAFRDIVKRDFDGKWPLRFTSDQEFRKRAFINLLKDHGCLDLDFSEPDEIAKNPVIERFHKTLALRLQKWRVATRQREWYKVLPEIIDAYNNSYHRTIRTTPNKVWNGTEVSKQVIRMVDTSFGIGDRVRFRLDKPVLRKGDRQTFSSAIYTIHSKQGNKFVLISDNGTIQKRKRRNYELVAANRLEQAPEPDGVVERQPIPAPRKLIRSDVDVGDIVTTKRMRKAKAIYDV